jgi:hypothetical protein
MSYTRNRRRNPRCRCTYCLQFCCKRATRRTPRVLWNYPEARVCLNCVTGPHFKKKWTGYDF